MRIIFLIFCIYFFLIITQSTTHVIIFFPSPLEHYKTTKKHLVGDYNALRYPVSHEVFLCCYLLLCFFLEITSKATAAKRTSPFTAFCQFASIPMIDIPLFRTPMKIAPITTPGTVPIPP